MTEAKMTKEQEDAFVRKVLEARAAERAEQIKAGNAEYLRRLEPALPAFVDGKTVKLDGLLEVLVGLTPEVDPTAAVHAEAAKLALERLRDHIAQRVGALSAEVVVPPTAELVA
jgi:hypothetical protein